MGFAHTVGLRYLRARRGFVSVVTGFSFVGIALGVAALIVVMAVMAGFRAELLDRILGTTGHAQLTMPVLTAEKAEQIRIEALDTVGINSAVPYVSGQAMIASNRKALGGLVRAVSGDDLRANKLINDNIIAGSLQGFGVPGQSPKIVLGKTLAQQLGVYVGDSISLMSSQGTHTIMGFVPRMMRAEVVAIFEVGMYQYDNALMFLPVDVAQSFYKIGELVTAIEVMVDKPAAIKTYLPQLQSLVDPTGHVITWVEGNRQFFEALKVERVAMFIILTLIVIVAAFNIITGQMMTVNDKKRDVAILRTMGADRGDILRLFFFSGFWVGLIGTFIGVVLGFVVIWQLHPIVSFIEGLTGARLFSGEAYFLSQLPAKIVPEEMITIVVVSLLLSMLASLYPAYKATKLDPVEALRNE
ncbi:MAG: lipoprotein-releasing system transmembrane subunit LolC [Magnetococcales bacterium]|nr:lipoprotein-releasing system transmembrane subunit LolC [Magnetococcales bacterium]